LAEPRSEGWIHTEAGNIGNASVSHHFSSREFRLQISIIKLSPGILPHRPSSHHSTVSAIQSPQRTIGGYIFWSLNVLPLRCYQCPLVPDCQTETPPLPSSQGTRRAANTTDSYSSRYWPGNFLRHGETPTQSRADIGCAG
jgi:hypothetical protein